MTMKNKLFDVREPEVVAHVTSHSEFVTEETFDEKSKRVLKSLFLRPIDLSKRYDGINPNDFALENLLSIGYDLKEMKIGNDRFRVLHDVEKYVNSVENKTKIE